MKLIIIKGNLKDGLGIVDKISSDNNSLPVLKNILIRADETRVQLITTNLEVAITTWVSGKIIEKGEVCVPIKILSELINNLPNERLNLENKQYGLEIKTDNYEAILQGLSSEEFPIVPHINNKEEFIEIKGSILKEALEQVLPSAQISEFRPELSSVLFDFSLDQIKLVATDSFRLSEKTISGSQYKNNYESGFKLLIPLKTAQEVNRITKDDDLVKIYKDNNQILFQSENWNLISRLIEGNFPDYTAIMPKSFETEVVIDRAELLNALKLSGVLSSKNNEIKIKIKEGSKALELYATDQSGENKYLLPAKIKGKPREISFNWKYLIDGLKILKSDEVFWGINEENRPAAIQSPQDNFFFYILMPILKA